ncbi:MAG: 2OG-Fe(II) oxygenase [Bacteroidota bacterium]
MNSTVTASEAIFNFDRWESRLTQDQQVYQREEPYPHIVLENFLEGWAARKAMESFPNVKDEGWIHYIHVNERKHGLNKMDMLPSFIQEVIQTLNSAEFVGYLEKLTGIPKLLPDPMLEGGGLHQTQRGGFLNIHADFTVHPHKRNWRRRVNVLVYLNEPWEEEYGGKLELWTRDMKSCVTKISPIFNRCVVFNTDEDSYHGQPIPLACPEDISRKSIALYYFTEEAETPRKRATNYKARPEDGLKSILIWADKQAIVVYNWLKGKLGINDDFVSNILKRFNKS